MPIYGFKFHDSQMNTNRKETADKQNLKIAKTKNL